MDKRADRGMSGKMAGKTVKRVGTDSGIGSRKGVKGDKGGVKGGMRDREMCIRDRRHTPFSNLNYYIR